MATQEWFPDLLAPVVKERVEFLILESADAVSRKEVSQGSRVVEPLCLEAPQHLVHNTGFCRQVVEVVVTNAKKYTVPLLGEVVKIPPLALWKEYFSMQGHCTTES